MLIIREFVVRSSMRKDFFLYYLIQKEMKSFQIYDSEEQCQKQLTCLFQILLYLSRVVRVKVFYK